MSEIKPYKQGFIDGLTAFAWWNEGCQEVGTSGVRLKEVRQIRHVLYYEHHPSQIRRGRQ